MLLVTESEEKDPELTLDTFFSFVKWTPRTNPPAPTVFATPANHFSLSSLLVIGDKV